MTLICWAKEAVHARGASQGHVQLSRPSKLMSTSIAHNPFLCGYNFTFLFFFLDLWNILIVQNLFFLFHSFSFVVCKGRNKHCSSALRAHISYILIWLKKKNKKVNLITMLKYPFALVSSKNDLTGRSIGLRVISTYWKWLK